MRYLLLILTALLSTSPLAQTNSQMPIETPKFEPAKQHKPMAKPANYQRIAILNINLKYDKGEAVNAELVRSRIIKSVAPKVFTRQMGDWQVIIDNNPKNTFFVNDPGYLEVENDDQSEVPYHYVSLGVDVAWDLVIPLYKDGQTIDASTITIKRVKDGKQIFETKI
ncbi:hypothetical protein Q4567_20825 [Aliiglaciecola sp. 2_MG-2023]|uniref:hypothetical protein n=1 Tax=unclassified Aliiglaciecola TaxID=2593648 RepID=UPI0026E1DC52|nr:MULTISPECIES: hypothetical protein [unclassified Aliiglaciecola]MDO6713193.1 hypothetical protein [Aliiglaciecola sp. 2_MG-2023]MDO6754321.1 hypothetical protein [Aliiglaciecola sp. 1_MG-2023]